MFAPALLPRQDPTAPPTALRRLAARLADSRLGMLGAGWYLEHVVSRIEPVLDRWSGGRVTSLPITPVVFLEGIGARTGDPRVTPLTYFTDGDDVILVGSNYGRSRQPAWYHNVKQHPTVTLRAGGRAGPYTVGEVVGPERDRLWALAVGWTPPLRRYQAMAGRRLLPIMRCTPAHVQAEPR